MPVHTSKHKCVHFEESISGCHSTPVLFHLLLVIMVVWSPLLMSVLQYRTVCVKQSRAIRNSTCFPEFVLSFLHYICLVVTLGIL